MSKPWSLLSQGICSQVSPVAFPRRQFRTHSHPWRPQGMSAFLPKPPIWLGWRVCVTSCTSHWAEQQKPEQTRCSFVNRDNYVDWKITRNNWADADVDALPSVFQTALVAPLCCSCPLSWWQIPVGPFVSPSSVYCCAYYISMLLLPSPCCKLYKADRLERCFLVHSSILLLFCSSFPPSLLLPFPIAPSDFPPALVAPLFSTTFSSHLLPEPTGRSLRGAWCLKGWV